LAHAGLVEQHVALRPVRRFDEAVAFGDVEPLDQTGHLESNLAQPLLGFHHRVHRRKSPDTRHGKNKVNTVTQMSHSEKRGPSVLGRIEPCPRLPILTHCTNWLSVRLN